MDHDLHNPHVAALLAAGLALPMLAWGLLAVSVPVIIHLVLRERPRREVFPAMRFLLRTHAQANRTQRLRQLLLLLARAAIIALAVGVLGRLGCAPRDGGAMGFTSRGAAPASVVICIDNSASMGYRYQNRTRVQAAKDRAASLLRDPRRFGPGSQFAVISGSPDAGTGGWRDDVRSALRALDAVQPAAHAATVADLLRDADTLLAAARHDRREVYVLTDLTQHGWDEPMPPPPTEPVTLYVLDVGRQENRNTALTWPEVPEHTVPADTPVRIPITIINGDLPAEPVLEIAVDGRICGRQSAGRIGADQQFELQLDLPPLTAGPHAVEVRMTPPDALDCDNTRYAWIVAGELPRVGIVQAPGGGDVGRMLRAMIAPPALPHGEHGYTTADIAVDSLLQEDLESCIAIVLADLPGLNGLAWDRLAGYAGSGGTLIIVPGPAVTPDGYNIAGKLLPAEVRGIETCEPPVRPAAENLSHEYLQPFRDTTIDSINDRYAFARLALAPVPDTSTTVIPFADDAPALIEATRAGGRAVLWAFSPHPRWGQFGTQAAPTIVLLHRMLEVARSPLRNVDLFAAGRAPLRRLDASGLPLTVVSGDGRSFSAPPASQNLFRLPADIPQTYQVTETSQPRRVLLRYGVNVDEAESRPMRLTPEEAKLRIGRDLAAIIGPDAETLAADGQAGRRIGWAVPLGMALLALLLVESHFANRFYGRQPS